MYTTGLYINNTAACERSLPIKRKRGSTGSRLTLEKRTGLLFDRLADLLVRVLNIESIIRVCADDSPGRLFNYRKRERCRRAV